MIKIQLIDKQQRLVTDALIPAVEPLPQIVAWDGRWWVAVPPPLAPYRYYEAYMCVAYTQAELDFKAITNGG